MTRANFSRRQTERLVLRAIVADDWPAIQCYMSDPLVTKWLPEGVMNEGQSRAFAIKNGGDQPKAVGVLLGESNEFIGHMVFHPWFAPSTHEIGWVFARQYQRLGYATEAAKSLIAYAFESLQCHRDRDLCGELLIFQRNQ